jgi:hypothetical protein
VNLIDKMMDGRPLGAGTERVVPEQVFHPDVLQLALFKLWRAYTNSGYHPDRFQDFLSTDHGRAICNTALNSARIDTFRFWQSGMEDEVGRTVMLSIDTPAWVDELTDETPQWVDQALMTFEAYDPPAEPTLTPQEFLDQSDYLYGVYESATPEQREAIDILIREQARREHPPVLRTAAEREEYDRERARELRKLRRLRIQIQQYAPDWELNTRLFERPKRDQRKKATLETPIMDSQTFYDDVIHHREAA